MSFSFSKTSLSPEGDRYETKYTFDFTEPWSTGSSRRSYPELPDDISDGEANFSRTDESGDDARHLEKESRRRKQPGIRVKRSTRYTASDSQGYSSEYEEDVPVVLSDRKAGRRRPNSFIPKSEKQRTSSREDRHKTTRDSRPHQSSHHVYVNSVRERSSDGGRTQSESPPRARKGDNKAAPSSSRRPQAPGDKQGSKRRRTKEKSPPREGKGKDKRVEPRSHHSQYPGSGPESTNSKAKRTTPPSVDSYSDGQSPKHRDIEADAKRRVWRRYKKY